MANILDKLQKLQSVMSSRQIAIKAGIGISTIYRLIKRDGDCKQTTANKIIKLYDGVIEGLVLTKSKQRVNAKKI